MLSMRELVNNNKFLKIPKIAANPGDPKKQRSKEQILHLSFIPYTKQTSLPKQTKYTL